MKKWILMCCAALMATGAWAAKEMSVQVRDGQLRNRASFLGKSGWIHESALTPKKVVLASGTADARVQSVGSEEVALAGKGFSKEVEAEYKKQNQDVDYTWVDWMGQQTVSSERLVAFLKQGNLAQ